MLIVVTDLFTKDNSVYLPSLIQNITYADYNSL